MAHSRDKIVCAIFASGNGSNAENIVRAAPPNLHIAVIICDKPGAKVIDRAVALNIPCTVITKGDETLVAQELKKHGVEWIFLAGYMRILKPSFIAQYRQRIVNIHPSLLPAFPGKDAPRQAFEAGVAESGVTLHYVDEGVDTGPIIAQARFAREAGDTLETFTARGQQLEYKLYADFITQLEKQYAD